MRFCCTGCLFLSAASLDLLQVLASHSGGCSKAAHCCALPELQAGVPERPDKNGKGRSCQVRAPHPIVSMSACTIWDQHWRAML